MPVSATLIFNARFFSFRQLAVFFAVVWGGSAVVFIFSDQFGIPFYSHPLVLACFFLLFFINTLNVCFRHCRFWLLKALVSTVKFVFVFYFARTRFHASRLIPVSVAAVIRVVTQGSSSLTAAHSSSAFLSLNSPIKSRLPFLGNLDLWRQM